MGFDRTQAIGFICQDKKKMYDTIDEVLDIFGGKKNFSMQPKINDRLHAYDFHNNQTVMVYLGSTEETYMMDTSGVRCPVLVYFLNFQDNAFYKKLYNSMLELKKDHTADKNAKQ